MKNELLWGLMLLVNFFSIIFIYRKFGKLGLFIWVPISSILANIQVVLLVNLFGFETTLGNIMYAGGFLVTDILSENYGEEEAKSAVKLGFFSMIVTAVIMKIAVSFVPSTVQAGAENFHSLKMIFDFMPRILFAGLVAYGVSQRHDVWAYSFWRNRFPSKKHIWIRNNASTLISQLIDNLIFTTIAFAGVYPMEVLVEIFVVTYVMKVIVATLDTPFVYLASYLKDKSKVSETVLV
nr:queuosine precursor transporter [uncultured Cetobacterium sp.]